MFVCKQCGENNQGEGKVTNGLCVDCYNDNKAEEAFNRVESEHDYDEAYMDLDPYYVQFED
jgi:NMD protein affecting ribosome stability and mRNA decay